MSKNYVPSFLKGQGGGQASSNQFAALSDDFNNKPLVNTSLPAREAPKLAPATLASLTSNGAGGGGKKSYASKFAEQAKKVEDPNYVPPPKPVDFTSADDFPSLGAPKNPSNVVVQPKAAEKPVGSFADMAKGWAKQKEEAEEKARLKAEREARHQAEKEQLRRVMPSIRLRSRPEEYDSEGDDYQDRPYDESSLGDSDSYEMPEDDQEPSEEDEENEEEFNNDIGYDGRRRGDLY